MDGDKKKYNIKKKLKLLYNPVVVFGSIIIGAIIGMKFTYIVPFIQGIQDYYINIYTMIATIMLPLAIIKGISGLRKAKEQKGFANKIVITFIIFMFLLSTTTILIGVCSQPIIKPDLSTKKSIGKIMIDNAEQYGTDATSIFITNIDTQTTETDTGVNKQKILDFFINLFPENIYNALAESQSVKIVSFSLIFGIVLLHMPKSSSKTILSLCDSVFDAFAQVLYYISIVLPIVLIPLVAVQFKGVTLEAIVDFWRFILYIFVSLSIAILICTCIIWKRTKKGFLEQVKILKEPLTIAFISDSNITAMPASIDAVVSKFQRKEDNVNLVIPLFASLGVFSSVIEFSVAGFFALLLYDYNITFFEIIILIIVSVFVSISSLDDTSQWSIGPLSLILGVFNIPVSAIMILLNVLVPFLEPFYTIVDVYISCTAGVLLAPIEKNNIRSEDAI